MAHGLKLGTLFLLAAGCTQQEMAKRVPWDAGAQSSGLPCDVQEMLVARCQSCHSSPPMQGVPLALITYNQLVAPAPSDATKKVVEVSITRMRSSSAPMPPTPASPATASEIAVLENWLASGLPRGSCGPTPTVCTSGNYWEGEESERMEPGRPCIACHTSSDEGPIFAIAGTVYPTIHEPDNCLGTRQGNVVIVGANQQTITLSTNQSGNFMREASMAKPYTAKVTFEGRDRVMATPQTSGDCNACHTEQGAEGAPGRIALP